MKARNLAHRLPEGIKPREAGVLLVRWFGPFPGEEFSPAPRAVVPETGEESVVNEVLRFELQDITFRHPYLTARGFEEEECEYLGCGYFPGRGTMAGRTVFPIHNSEGQLVAYAGRLVDDSAISEANPRWKLPGGFRKHVELFNLHRVLETTGPRSSWLSRFGESSPAPAPAS